MNNNDTYKDMIKDAGLKRSEVAKMLGLGSEKALSRKLVYGITVGSLYKLSKALGYEVVIQKRGESGEITKEWVIDSEEE